MGPGEIHPENGYQLPEVPPAGMTRTGYIVTKYWYMPPVQGSGINAPILRIMLYISFIRFGNVIIVAKLYLREDLKMMTYD